MDLNFVREKAGRYHSLAQRTRVMSEAWGARELYCPACSTDRLQEQPPNTRAIDYACSGCGESWQLKAVGKPLGARIVDAGYHAMIDAIRSEKAPGLFVLHYSPESFRVRNLLVVPRFFFTESAIEARRPLGPTARRAGWIGCNIRLDSIARDGKIPIVREAVARSRAEVRAAYQSLRALEKRGVESRGWTLDVLRCVRELGEGTFDLADVYAFQPELSMLHPENHNVQAKIRQQLQVLRDLGVLEFLPKRGTYRVRASMAQRTA